MAQSTANLHLVRVGAMAHVGRFASADARRYPRGAKVVLRTVRGLETGEVLDSESRVASDGASEGAIVRGVTEQDELLSRRLAKNRREAYEACAARIGELDLDVALMDVEQLFDGRTLVFYFLGDPPPELDRLTAELASTYDAHAHIRRFAEVLAQGCGPDCGTEDAEGSGCELCAAACKAPRSSGD